VITGFNTVQKDSINFSVTALNETQNGGLGANAQVDGDRINLLNSFGTATALKAGINRVYVAGTWNGTTFQNAAGTPADFMVFDVTLVGPVAANSVVDITSQFKTAEALILDAPTFAV
jgi:hypothetical protein